MSLFKNCIQEFNWKHTLKHTIITTALGLTGPWGVAIGVTYCAGDTVDKAKKCKPEDITKVLQSVDTRVLNEWLNK